jgi:sortase A
VAVVEGIDEEALDIGAGHMPGTPLWGQPGNVVIAAHRDLSFHPLRKVRPGDVIETNAGQPYRYRVDRISIVDPEDVTVLAGSHSSTLTLITCYPFSFIGNAPKRFIVRATLLKSSG